MPHRALLTVFLPRITTCHPPATTACYCATCHHATLPAHTAFLPTFPTIHTPCGMGFDLITGYTPPPPHCSTTALLVLPHTTTHLGCSPYVPAFPSATTTTGPPCHRHHYHLPISTFPPHLCCLLFPLPSLCNFTYRNLQPDYTTVSVPLLEELAHTQSSACIHTTYYCSETVGCLFTQNRSLNHTFLLFPTPTAVSFLCSCALFPMGLHSIPTPPFILHWSRPATHYYTWFFFSTWFRFCLFPCLAVIYLPDLCLQHTYLLPFWFTACFLYTAILSFRFITSFLGFYHLSRVGFCCIWTRSSTLAFSGIVLFAWDLQLLCLRFTALVLHLYHHTTLFPTYTTPVLYLHLVSHSRLPYPAFLFLLYLPTFCSRFLHTPLLHLERFACLLPFLCCLRAAVHYYTMYRFLFIRTHTTQLLPPAPAEFTCYLR